jgi:hypothetical protein
MTFARFWRRRPRSDQGDGLIGSRAGPDPDLAGEVAAFLEGRLVDHFVGAGQTVPAWAVLNRLAHADRPALVRLVESAGPDRVAHPSSGQPPWLATERIVAGHLLAKATTAEDLARVQHAALVPLELRVIERSKLHRLTAEQVLEAGSKALDSFRFGR